jgi:hypothetical protein
MVCINLSYFYFMYNNYFGLFTDFTDVLRLIPLGLILWGIIVLAAIGAYVSGVWGDSIALGVLCFLGILIGLFKIVCFLVWLVGLNWIVFSAPGVWSFHIPV